MASLSLSGTRRGCRVPVRPFSGSRVGRQFAPLCRASQPSRPEVQNGSSRPEDATLECLTLLRKADARLIEPWVGRVEQCSWKVLSVGGYAVDERSPFISCHQVMDAAARRVLPGHLLRRCQVLSSFTLGDTCQQRVSITGCSGEQSVFAWLMKRQPGPEGQWVVQSIRRDPLQDEDPDNAASRPHPRLSPEAVIKAQLAMLQRGDVEGAARFNLWGRSTSGGSEVHQDGFRALLRKHPYHQLLTHSSSSLGAAALPTPHHFVQEVEVLLPPTPARAEAAVCLVWDLRLQGNGCWATCGIRPSIL